MKEHTNITLWIYEKTFGRIKTDTIKNKGLAAFAALALLFIVFPFIILALGIEEPLKCLFAVITRQSSPEDAWFHYKKCWGSLSGGMKIR